MRELLDVTMVNVRYVSIRRVAGDGDQQQLTIQTKHGSLTIRLIPEDRDQTIRVLDYRAKDKKKHDRTNPLGVHTPNRS